METVGVLGRPPCPVGVGFGVNGPDFRQHLFGDPKIHGTNEGADQLGEPELSLVDLAAGLGHDRADGVQGPLFTPIGVTPQTGPFDVDARGGLEVRSVFNPGRGNSLWHMAALTLDAGLFHFGAPENFQFRMLDLHLISTGYLVAEVDELEILSLVDKK